MVNTSKIEKLSKAFIRGSKISPADVFNRYKIQANTFHRCLNSLKKNGWVFNKEKIKKTDGTFYTKYWLESRPL